jgi:hypothetical protein
MEIVIGLCCVVPSLTFVVYLWIRGQSSNGGQSAADWNDKPPGASIVSDIPTPTRKQLAMARWN